MKNNSKSAELQKEAARFLVGGVNSPVRSFRVVGSNPIFVKSAKGSRITDADGNEYIDYIGAYGPMILGHAHDDVVTAIHQALRDGFAFGSNTQTETELARLVLEAYPFHDKIRFVNSGTEAVMSAIRLARGFTKRSKIMKFAGCYHGHMDDLLVAGGSGVATLGLADSAGVTKEAIQNTIVVPYNDIDSVGKAFDLFKDDIAAVIIEPVAGNMSLVLPRAGFLRQLYELCNNNQTLLISDEIMCGFRKEYASVMGSFKVQADITCVGKIIGGGLPVGAYMANSMIMDHLAPLGPVYQAGTMSGSPAVMAAGIATLKQLRRSGFYSALADKTSVLVNALNDRGLAANQFGSMFGFFFSATQPNNFEAVKNSVDSRKFKDFFNKAREAGLFIPPSPFETWFVSSAHSVPDIEKTSSFFERYSF